MPHIEVDQSGRIEVLKESAGWAPVSGRSQPDYCPGLVTGDFTKPPGFTFDCIGFPVSCQIGADAPEENLPS